MIAVDRGAEPEDFAAERRYRFSRAWLAWRAGSQDNPGEELLKDGWDKARSALHERQHGKCAFCEAFTYKREHPTEHFRPRELTEPWLQAEAPRRTPLRDRYWWLAWSWENVLFACKTCNGRGRKGNRFPFMSGGAALTPPPRTASIEADFEASFQLADEDPARLLIDPTTDDPSKHLRWTPWIDRRPAKRGDDFARMVWRPEARRTSSGPDARGRETISVFGLDNDAQEAVGRHAKRFHQRCAKHILSLLARSAPRWEIAAAWDQMCDSWLRPSDEFLLATHCIVDFLFPEDPVRKEHVLSMPALPAPVSRPRRPILDDGPLAPHLSRVASFELRMRIRAREDRSSLSALLLAEPALDATTIEALFASR